MKRFVCRLLLLGIAWSTVSLCSSQSFAADIKTTHTVELVAVGDDLIHDSVYKAAKRGNTYNFSPIFEHVKSDIQAADLAVINQETILVDRNYSGYPSFGSPKKVANAIHDAGFHVVTHATNHTMDRGTGAITGTLRYWNSRYPDISILGIHKSQKDANKITVREVNGVKIAMMNYTYGLNGYRVPAGKKYMVDMLTSSNKSKIKSDIRRAKKQSDFVIVFAHFGTEYRYSPDSSQKSWAKFFLEQGVDLLIGAHPHVLEPYKMMKGANGHTMLVYYSLGNFVSGQNKMPRMLGGMAKVTIVKDSKGTRIRSYDLKPLVTHISKNGKQYTVYKLSDYTDRLAKQHKLRRSYGSEFSVRGFKNLYRSITGKDAS